MGVASDGSYGIAEGVVFSYPVRLTGGGEIRGEGVFRSPQTTQLLSRIFGKESLFLANAIESLENVDNTIRGNLDISALKNLTNQQGGVIR